MNLLRVGTGFVLAAALTLGLWMAAHSPLENDEYYSLTRSVMKTSYAQMFKGSINEGNNSPLFYFLQKLQCNIFLYHPSQAWMEGRWEGEDVFSQVFLRVQSIFWIALALSSVFYFFASRYSLWVGAYALMVALSSSMLWCHWTEARPYALWFCLSMFQVLILLELFQEANNQEEKDWKCLTVVHWLLALTATISIIQMAVAGIVLAIFRQRRWVTTVIAFGIPMLVCLFYYVMAPKYHFFFKEGPLDLVNANFPKDRLMILFIFALVLIYKSLPIKDWRKQLELRYFVFVTVIILFFVLLLMKMQWSTAGIPRGFQVSNRYLIPLAPVGIVATTLFSMYLVKAFQSQWVRAIVVLVLLGFLMFRIQKTMTVCQMPDVLKLRIFSSN
ncbi:MAG: hypothetical protein HQL15_00830 [Candidatus Omnitrophica bacterium]|nr:hypothetical protein [Candidatus Omnitrophota bacterium]